MVCFKSCWRYQIYVLLREKRLIGATLHVSFSGWFGASRGRSKTNLNKCIQILAKISNVSFAAGVLLTPKSPPRLRAPVIFEEPRQCGGNRIKLSS